MGGNWLIICFLLWLQTIIMQHDKFIFLCLEKFSPQDSTFGQHDV